MIVPMLVLAALCLWIGLAPQTMALVAFAGGAMLTHVAVTAIQWDVVLQPLSAVISCAFLFLALVVGLAALRRLLMGDRTASAADTWECAFAKVTPRFQYTSSSFARSIIDFVQGVLQVRRHGGVVKEIFPEHAHAASSVHDAAEESFFRPLLYRLTMLSKVFDANRIRYTQMYLVYIFLFLIFLLAWKIR